MNDSALDILAVTFKNQDTIVGTNSYTFESKITVLDKNIGPGCPVHVFEKATGALIYTTETDNDSFIYVPNLSKKLKYFIVATDISDLYNSVIFDLTWDFASQSDNNYNLKFYTKYLEKDLKNLYEYFDNASSPLYDQDLLYSISMPRISEDQGSDWFIVGSLTADVRDGFPCFVCNGSTASYTYIGVTPVVSGEAFTIECFINCSSLPNGKTVAGNIISQTSGSVTQALSITDTGRLVFKNKNIVLESISTVPFDEWVHVALVYDSASIYIFINGVNVATAIDSVGFEYFSTVFALGAGFYGAISSFALLRKAKYVLNFEPVFKPYSYTPVIYLNENDEYANQTVIKTIVDKTRSQNQLRDVASNIPFTDAYTTRENSYIVSNNSFCLTATSYKNLVLSKSFTIEMKFRLTGKVGTDPTLLSNKTVKGTFTTDNWRLIADYPNYLEKYAFSMAGTNISTTGLITNYPCIYNEPVSLVVQKDSNTWKFFVNGVLDKTVTYTHNVDTKTSAYLALGGDLNFEMFDLKITQAARYDTEVTDNFTIDSDTLKDVYYCITNLPFKSSLVDIRSSLNLIFNNVSLSIERSSYNTRSAYFKGGYLTTNKSYWYTPYEDFTIEMKISFETLPLKTEDTENIATLVDIFSSTLNNFKVGVVDKYLAFYDGISWTKTTYTFNTEASFKHIVIQRQGNVLKLLADGSLIQTFTTPDLSGRRDISIGSNKLGTENFNGFINNLKIYKSLAKFEDNYDVVEDPDESVDVSVEKEPEVIVNNFTTSALNFESGLVDKIGTTTWELKGSAKIQSDNHIFGENSLETKELGDSLHSSSNLITGGTKPYTVEFYTLVRPDQSQMRDLQVSLPLFLKSFTKSSGTVNLQGVLLVNPYESNASTISPFTVRTYWNEISDYSKFKVRPNEINKFTITYDSAAIRVFVNDKLTNITGSEVGLYNNLASPYAFMQNYNVSSGSGVPTNSVTKAILDNINIHDGVATITSEGELYKESLIVDLSFEGSFNSTKIVDNGTYQKQWTAIGGANLASTSIFPKAYTGLYLNGTNSYIKTSGIDLDFGVSDFTISFKAYVTSYNNPYQMVISNSVSNKSYIVFWGDYSSSPTLARRITIGIASDVFLTSSITYVLNKVYEISVVRKNSTVYLYIDGKLDSSLTTSAIFNLTQDSQDVAIGYRLNTGVAGNFFTGYLKDFKIYKGVAITPPKNNSRRIIIDFAENNFKDVYNLATTSWTPYNVSYSPLESYEGNALYLPNRSSSYVVTNSPLLNFSNQNFTVNMVLKPTVKNDNHSYCFTNSVTPTTDGAIWLHSGSYGFLGFDYQGKPSDSTSLQVLKVPLNTYYDAKTSRFKDTVFYNLNDVTVAVQTLDNPNKTFNFIQGGVGAIGKHPNFNSAYSFTGYIDKFEAVNECEAEITQPSIYFPLNRSFINLGSNVVTYSISGTPIFEEIQGKLGLKCSSNYRVSCSQSNSFYLSSKTDFYLEVDFYPTDLSVYNVILSNLSSSTSYLSALTIGAPNLVIEGNSYPNGIYLYVDGAARLVTTTAPIGSAWNKLKLYRKDSVTYLDLNGNTVSTTANFNINFGYSGFAFGRPNYSSTSDFNGYISEFKLYSGKSSVEDYDYETAFDLDFSPALNKAYLFYDKAFKNVIMPNEIPYRDYKRSEYCCTFNGSNQYLVLGRANNFNLDIDDFVLSIDLEYESTSRNYLTILSGGSETGASENNSIMIVANKGASTTVYNNSLHVKVAGQVVFNLPEGSLQPNIKYNFSITRQNGVFSLYIDKALVEINNSFLRTKFNLNQSDCTYIGKVGHNDNEHFQGSIYNMKLLRGTSDLTKLEPVVAKPTDPIPQLPEFDISARPYSVLFRFDNSLVDSVSLQALTMPSGVYPKYIAGFSTEVPGSGALDIDGVSGQRTLLVPTGLKSIFNLDGDFTLGFDINVKDVTEHPLIVSSQTESIYSMYIGLAPNTSDTSLYNVAINESLSSGRNYKVFKSNLLKFNTNVNIKIIRQGTLIRAYVNNYFIGEVEWATALNFNMYNKPLLCGYTAGGNSIPTCHFDSFFICKGYVEFSHTIKTEEDSV